jgi:hypothetical protein
MSSHIEVALIETLAPYVSGRMHPLHLPDGVSYPAFVYSMVGLDSNNTMCGESDLDNARYRIDIYDKDWDNILVLRRNVRTALDSMFAYPAVCVGEFDLYEPEQRLYHKAVDFSIWAKKPSQ